MLWRVAKRDVPRGLTAQKKLHGLLNKKSEVRSQKSEVKMKTAPTDAPFAKTPALYLTHYTRRKLLLMSTLDSVHRSQ